MSTKNDDLPDFDPLPPKARLAFCPKCISTKLTMVQYGRGVGTERPCHPCHYDGWSEIKCEDCGHRVGAWSGRTLTGDDHEPPNGIEHRSGCRFAGRMIGIPAAAPPNFS